MRILLLCPPYNSTVESVAGFSSLPLGLAYLASVLRERYEVKIVDSNALGYGMEDVRRELKKFYPDVVGITCTTPSVPQAYKVAKLAKQVREDCLVILGGPHVSFLPVQTLKECEYVDVVVKGEGEETMKELIEAVEKEKPLEDVRGITFRKGNRIVDNPARPFIRNIDEIPFPSRDL